MKVATEKVQRSSCYWLPAVALMCATLVSPVTGQPPTTINVEIDFMADATHSHTPGPNEIDAVVQMFACHGITLNVDVDDQIPHINIIQCNDPGADPFFTCNDPDSFATIKAANFDRAGVPGWHYCVFGHDYDAGKGTGSSGIAEGGGDDLLVTMGSFDTGVGTEWDRAATLAHELGHNLGLGHTSPLSPTGDGDYPPNYASIMSYQYQLHGVRTQLECLGLIDSTALFKDLDYSNGRLPSIFEHSLSEVVGVGIHKVDWDCDGSIASWPVSQDLDHRPPWCGDVGVLTHMSDYDDWSNIVDNTFAVGVEQVQWQVITCITASEHYRMQQKHLADPTLCPPAYPTGQPDVVQEQCVSGKMIWVDPSYSGPEYGTGDKPFRTVILAYQHAPMGSVLYLQAGTHSNSGSALVLSKRLVLAGPGGAVIDP